jgi:hypothetical protein
MTNLAFPPTLIAFPHKYIPREELLNEAIETYLVATIIKQSIVTQSKV